MNESERTRIDGLREKQSRLTGDKWRWRSQSRHKNHQKSNKHISKYQKDIDKLQKYHSNINGVLSALKHNRKKAANFQLNLHSPQQTQYSNSESSSKNIAQCKKLKENSLSAFHQKKINFNIRDMSPMHSEEIKVHSPTSQANGRNKIISQVNQRKTKILTPKINLSHSKITIEKMVRSQNSKLKKARNFGE